MYSWAQNMLPTGWTMAQPSKETYFFSPHGKSIVQFYVNDRFINHNSASIFDTMLECVTNANIDRSCQNMCSYKNNTIRK